VNQLWLLVHIRCLSVAPRRLAATRNVWKGTVCNLNAKHHWHMKSCTIHIAHHKVQSCLPKIQKQSLQCTNFVSYLPPIFPPNCLYCYRSFLIAPNLTRSHRFASFVSGNITVWAVLDRMYRVSTS